MRKRQFSLPAALVVTLLLGRGAAAQGNKPSFEGLKALQHPDAIVRYKAAAVLAKLGPQAKFAIGELRKILNDPDPFVRVKAAEALWKVEQPPPFVVVPTLVKALADRKPEVRAGGARVLAMLGPKAKSAVPALVKALKDDDFDVKSEVALALADIGPAAGEAVLPLLAMTDDKELSLFEPLLCTTLGSLGVVEPLAKALSHQDVRKRRVAAAALDFMGADAREAVKSLAKAVTDQEPAVRSAACSALGKIGPQAREALALLQQAFKDKETSVRIRAGLAAWQISGQDDSLTILTDSLKNESPLLRHAACEAIAKMGPAAAKAAPTLAQSLTDPESRVRKEAVLALANIGPAAKDFEPVLKKCLQDKDEAVRLESAFALWKVTGNAVATVAVLKGFLSDDSSEQQFALRARALNLAGEMGPASLPLVPFLFEILRDEDSDFRTQAAHALKKIDPKEAARAGIR